MNPELTPEVLKELRTSLEQSLAEQRARVRSEQRLQGAGDTPDEDSFSDAPGDYADASVDLQQADIGTQVLRDADERINEITAALARMDNGTYGDCATCGKPIPLGRLRIVPEARYDVQHQQEAERRR